MNQEIKQKIEEAEVISFDVFDTLLMRIVDRPETIFSLMETHFKIKDFAKKRVEFQHQSSRIVFEKNGYPHSDIDEIYACMGENTDWNVEEMKAFEIQIEEDSLFRNPEMYEIYQYAKKCKKRVVATSDMYIKRKDIKRFLSKNGYEMDEIYVSADERAAKFNEELFHVLIKKEKVDPSKIFHIGDNLAHDYENAQKVGIISYHYTGTIAPKTMDPALSFHYGVRRILEKKSNDFYQNFGTHMGLLYLELFKKLEENKEKNIYFLARDGYNLFQIFQKYSKKKSNYIYISRRSLLLAGITKLDAEALSLLPPFTLGQSLEEILSYMHFDDLDLSYLEKVGIENTKYRIKTEEDIQKVKKFFTYNEEKILKICTEEREYAKAYFEKEGFLKEDLVFDCGWNGSSQYLLERVIGPIHPFTYVGIFDNEKSRRQLDDKNFDTYLFGIGDTSPKIDILKDHAALLELFFGAPHASTLYYNKDGYILENIEEDFSYKEKILDGLMSYFELALPFYQKYIESVDKNSIIEDLIHFCQNPKAEEAVQIGDIHSVDGFAFQKGVTKYIAKVTMEDLKKNPNIEIYWKEALLARPDIEEDVKAFVKKKYALYEEECTIPQGYLKRCKNALKNHGYMTTAYLLKQKVIQKIFPKTKDEYYTWIKNNEKKERTKKLSYEPLISIVVPVYNVLEEQLIPCIESVLNQNYSNFELCLVDDASTMEVDRDILKKYEEDPRIHVLYHSKNEHISKTTNDGIDLAHGEFIGLLDCDDILAPFALYEVAKALNENPHLDFIYSDEDKLTADGKYRHSPFFKPDFSLDTYLSLMYTCHFSVFRKKIAQKIGGFTVGLDGAQDYDFTLRFIEETKKIHHIPKILYHWREREESIASNPEAKPYALSAIVSLKEQYLKRNKIKGKVLYEPSVFQYKIAYESKEKCVSILYYVNEKIEKLPKDSSIKEIILLDASKEGKWKEYSKEKKWTYIRSTRKKIEEYNEASSKAKGKILFFLEADTHMEEGSIDLLCGYALQNHIALTGPKLLYKGTHTIASNGLTYGENMHLLNGQEDTIPHYYCHNKLPYNILSVSEKALMIRKEVFIELGGFKEKKGSTSALELGKEAHKQGYFSVIQNDAKGYVEKVEEPHLLYTIENDPFVNPNVKGNQFNINHKRPYEKIPVIQLEEGKENKKIEYRLWIQEDETYLHFNGYAFLKDFYHNNSSKISILLKGKEQTYAVLTQKVYRPDLSTKYGQNVNFASFRVSVRKENLPHENFGVQLSIRNRTYKIHQKIDVKQKVGIK